MNRLWLALCLVVCVPAWAEPLQPDTEYACKLTCSAVSVPPVEPPPVEPPPPIEPSPPVEPPPPAAGMPDWAAAIPAGQWVKVTASNTTADIDPAKNPTTNSNYPGGPSYNGTEGFSGLWDDWTGGAYAPDEGPCGSIIYWGGGHAGYWGNEVISLDVCGGAEGAPLWRRLSDPYDAVPWGSQGPGTYTAYPDGFPDGTPPAIHSYDGVEYLANIDSFVTVHHGGHPAQGQQPALWTFSLATNQWTGPTKYTPCGRHQTSAYDSQRGLFWYLPVFMGYACDKFTSFDPVTRAITEYEVVNTSPYVSGQDSMMAYNPVDDLLVITNFRQHAQKIMAERPAGTPAIRWKQVVEHNKPDVRGGHAMEWSDARQAFIIWFHPAAEGQRSAVYEVKRDAGEYHWSLLTSANNAVVPALTSTQIYTRYKLVKVGDDEILMGMSRPRDGIYAFKIPKSATPVADICSHPGVFHCELFDDADIAPAKLYTGTAMPFVEDGKLVMLIPELSGANPGGDYRFTFPPVGPGSTLAFSFKIKADAGAVATPGRKQFVLWGGQASCNSLELAQSHGGSPVVVPYTECGATNTYMPIPGTSDYQLHYPDYDCKYQAAKAGNYAGCVISVADVWDHFYIETEMGEPNTPTSRLTMWHRKGGPWKRYIHRTDWTFRSELYSQNGWNNLMLTPYVTRKDPTVPGPAGRVEYDELVMSTEPFLEALL